MPSSAVPPQPPRLLACGDGAVAVEFGDTVDPAHNARVLALDARLRAEPPPGFVESVPTYRSLLVHYDSLATDLERLGSHLLALASKPSSDTGRGRLWRVPVVYGGVYGIDLDDVADEHGLSPREVAAIHASATYRVYMIGFMPGYAMLGGLDPRIATSRRTSPRLTTPAGSVSIGGVQALIASIAAPSGWHLLGRTPMRNYMPGRDPVFLLEPGDAVRFEPVSEREWARLDRAAAAGEPVATRVDA